MDLGLRLLVARCDSDNFWNQGLLRSQDCGPHLELQKSKTVVKGRRIHRWRDSGWSSQDLHDGIPHRQMSRWARDFKVEGAQAQVLVKRSAGDELNLILICSGLFSRTHLRWNLMKLIRSCKNLDRARIWFLWMGNLTDKFKIRITLALVEVIPYELKYLG